MPIYGPATISTKGLEWDEIWVCGVERGLVPIGRATTAVIRANLVWASAYNVIALPAAALGYLNPLFAGIAMSASSLFVVANSLRLRRYRPKPRRQ